MTTSGAQPPIPIGLPNILDTLKRLGFGAAVAVPDSWLGEILVRIEQEPTMRLVRATHEEEALAIACGIRLGGVRTAMFVQNAGLLSMGAGMVSLAQRYQFPLLMLVSYRGTVEDPVFYHVPKGRVTEPVSRASALAYVRADRTGRSVRRSKRPQPMPRKHRARSRCCCRGRTSNGERQAAEQGRLLSGARGQAAGSMRLSSPPSAMRPICGPPCITRRRISTSRMRWASRCRWRSALRSRSRRGRCSWSKATARC